MKMHKLMFGLILLPALAMAGPNKKDAELALTEARSSVEAAERAGAMQHATPELNMARDDLARATGTFEERDWDDSVMASEKTRADANLAEARSRQHRAEATTAEVEAAIHSLQLEVDSKGGTP